MLEWKLTTVASSASRSVCKRRHPAPGLGESTGSPQFKHVSVDDFRIVQDNMAGSGRATASCRVSLPIRRWHASVLAKAKQGPVA